MKNTINIFSETGCIPHEILWKYRQGKLSASEKHAVEVHLTDCELCSDALAGMMNMETDEMMAGLRKSVRNISVPKKVIRFYDFRILSAAAAAAVLIVFTYVINSHQKQDKKEIAQVIVPQEPKKEKSSPVAKLNEQPKKAKDTLIFHKPLGNNGNKAIASNAIHTPSLPTTQENFSVIADADKQAETAVEKDNAEGGITAVAKETESSGYSAPAPPAAKISRYKEAPGSVSKNMRSMQKKSADAESSKTTYINDLKVARTPAMSASENSDTVPAGIPAMFENANQAAADTLAREMPFVYSKTLKDGMDYFHNKQYTEASQSFSIILERFPNDVNSLFYKGLSEMEMQNYPQSSELLNKAMLNSNKTFYEEAKFKLALCYVAMNKKAEAEKLLREITKKKGFYTEKTTDELQQLK